MRSANNHSVFFLLGSNIGNKKKYIDDAKTLIEQKIGKIVNQSSLYESEAWGFECQSTFYNNIVEIKSILPPTQILEITQSIEQALGRTLKTNGAYHSRTIDIDILFYDNEIIETPKLTIPHVQIQFRKFALLPLAEVAPNFMHPKLRKNIATLLAECTDNCWVRKI